MTLLVAPPGEDRWFAVIDAAPLVGEGLEELFENLPPPADTAALDIGVAERAVAAFGMEWAALTGPVMYAMCALLATAPADFGQEFMRWEPEEIRWMREHTILGGSASFVEAVRCLHGYRRASSLDIRPPLRAGD